jgi:hypothetical protein
MGKKIRSIIVAVILAIVLALTIFSVQRGVRYFLQAESEPGPIPSPTSSPEPTLPKSFEPIQASPTSQVFTLPTLPPPTPAPSYTLRNFQDLLEAIGTNNPQWDLNSDGAVDQTDLDIFKNQYL